ncbi:MAG: hypothetical protein ACKO32_10210 [Planctomycetia bacterium]
MDDGGGAIDGGARARSSRLSVQPNGERWLEAPLGKRIVEYGVDGSVAKVLRQQGNGLVLTKGLSAEVSGEPSARLSNPRAAAGAADHSKVANPAPR